MIVLPQREIDAIRNPRIRRREIRLPVRREAVRGSAVHPLSRRALEGAPTLEQQRPSGAATRRCPLRAGGNYAVRGDGVAVRYAELRKAVADAPNRARGVVWLLQQVEDETRPLRITVREVLREGDEWVVRFWLDSTRAIQERLDDTPILLARGAGYAPWDEIDAGELMSPLAEDLRAARQRMREGRAAPQREALQRAAGEVTRCREVMQGVKQRTRLALALKEIERARAEVDVRARAELERGSDEGALGTASRLAG